MRPLSAREHRLVAVALLVAAVAVVWLGALSPLLDGFLERSARRETLEAEYARNQRTLASIPFLKRQAVAQERTAGRFAIVAPAQPVAAQMLQQRVAKTIGEVGGVLSSAGPLESTTPKAVRVQGQAQLTMQQLYQFLKRLESEEPYVVVEHFSVAADRAFETGHLAVMDVRFRISAAYSTVPAQ